MAQINIALNGVEKIAKQLEKDAKKAETAMVKALKDVKTRVQPPIAKEVAKVYNINKKEVRASKQKKDGTVTKTSAGVEIRGRLVDQAVIVYTGKPLSFNGRFDVKPNTPPNVRPARPRAIAGKYLKMKKVAKGKGRGIVGMAFTPEPYPVRATVIKGHPEILNNAFLGKTRVDSDHIPFVRFKKNGDPRYAVKPLRTISVPQMISNEKVRPNVDKVVSEVINKRLEARFNYFLKK